MGLNTKILNVQQEIRWKVFAMEKDMNISGKVSITLAYEEGYYNDKDVWVCTNNQVMYVSGDAAKLFAGAITPQTLGKSSSHPLGVILDTALYGILSGQISTTADISVIAKSSVDNSNLVGTFTIVDSKGNSIVSGNLGGDTYKIPVLLSPTITIHATGYNSITLNPSVVQGIVVLTPQLTPIEPTPEE